MSNFVVNKRAGEIHASREILKRRSFVFSPRSWTNRIPTNVAGHQFTAHVFCKPLSYHNGTNKNLEFSFKALKSSSTSKLSVIIEWVARKGVKIRFSNSLITCPY